MVARWTRVQHRFEDRPAARNDAVLLKPGLPLPGLTWEVSVALRPLDPAERQVRITAGVISAYMRGMHGARTIRPKLFLLDTYKELLHVLDSVISRYEEYPKNEDDESELQ